MQQPRFPPPQRPTPPPPGGVGLRGRPPPPPVPTKSAPAAPSTGTAGAAPAAAVPQATAGGALLRGPGTGAPLPPHFAAIRELVQSEQHYVTVLRVFLSNFLQPLRQEAIVNAEDESTLVGPVEELLKVNTDLCQKLSPPGEVISLLCVVDVFSEMMEPMVKIYEGYCTRYKQAKDKLNDLIQDPVFCTFVEKLEVANKFNLHMLRNFINLPLQRICHYPLILRELTKYLPPEADAVKWKEAIVRLESTATTVNINKADAKKIEKLLEIEKKIEHLEKPIAIIGRHLVLEGPLKIRKKQAKDGYVYLFSDAILLSKNTAGGKPSFAGLAPLNHCVVHTLEDFDKTAVAKHGFQITVLDTQKKWQFYCQNAEERQKWVQKIHDTTAALLSIGSAIWENTVDSSPILDDNMKQRERIKELESERTQMSYELSAFRFNLRGERNEKLNLLESNVSLSSKANKQKLLINKMWNYLRIGNKLGDAELKALEGEVQGLLGTLALGANSVASATPVSVKTDKRTTFFSKPGSGVSATTERKVNFEEAPVFYHAAKHSSPYYYSAEKPEEGQNDFGVEDLNLFQYITRDDDEVNDERRGSTSSDDPAQQRRVSVARPTSSYPLAQKIELQLPDDVIKVGYLSKKGAKRRNWKDRWFILKKDSIGYYANPTDTTPKGTISLRRCSVFTSTRKPFCFHVSNLNRDYYIVAKNQQEQKEWMEAITDCIEELKKEEEEQPEAAAALEKQRSAYQAGAEKEGTLMYEESPGRWASNWLSLKEGRLYLFSSRTDPWPHGVIELEGCIVELDTKSEDEKKKKKKAQFVFIIMNPAIGSTRFSERERAEWVTAIDIACRNAEARKKAEEEAEAKAATEQTEDDEAAKMRSLLELFAQRT